MLSILDTKDSNQPMQTEVAINVDETLFRAAFEHSPVGIALVSLDGYYLKANHRLCEILGYTETELLSRRTCDVTHPDDNPTNQNQVAQLLAGEITESDVEKRYLHRSGRVIWAQRVTALLRDDQVKPRYFITQVQDLTRAAKPKKRWQIHTSS